ncbi:DUF6205 family protein [Streptomyces bobili]|uniref:DUF6205 family protein n=1 Tax=Streptomyces bobili TaxID=67280 RepID=UPI00344AEB60
MGYYTSVTGEIRIEPPLTWAEIKSNPLLPETEGGRSEYDVRLRIDEETVETDEGQMIRKTCSALVPAWDDSFKAYHLIEHVQFMVDTFPGHTFSGRLDCEGEENGDLWRVVIRDGRAEKVTPRIVWPDED